MDEIDHLLLQWHEWETGWEPVAGYERCSSFGERFRSSRQWMTATDLHDEVDFRERRHVGRIVDPLITALDLRLRVAVNVAMKNFAAGRTVWINPRWPETQTQDYARAKAILAPQFAARGLISKAAQDRRLAVRTA